ncbi:D-Galactonate repressor DgoR [Klebsiella pneumoniae]|nr:D-Galactonate repressor DgoR [Klebsiella pneumoniae]
MTLNKTDRIVISLGKQIVSGKYVPGSALPPKRNSVRSLKPRATSSAKCFVP